MYLKIFLQLKNTNDIIVRMFVVPILDREFCCFVPGLVLDLMMSLFSWSQTQINEKEQTKEGVPATPGQRRPRGKYCIEYV